MRKSAREFLARKRELQRAARALRNARKAVVMPGPHSAKEYLLALGLPQDFADRYTSAFSKGVTAVTKIQHEKKLPGKRKGVRTIIVEVKLYDWETFARRLTAYRPRDIEAAARFADLATLVAA